MTYLPELRESLVQAAQRQARPAPGPARARRPRPLGALLLMGTSLTALVVAGIVLVLVGHRSSGSSASAQYGSRTAALAAAQEIIAGFRAPAGAVAVSNANVPAAGRHPGAVEVHRFYIVRGGVDSVMRKVADTHASLSPALARAASAGFPLGSYSESASASSESGSSSGPSGPTVVDSATTTILLSNIGALARELDIQVLRVGPGTSAIRVDAQAWWLLVRPADERIPLQSDRVSVRLVGRLPSAHAHRATQLTGASAAEVVSRLNALPRLQPDETGFTCRAQPNDLRVRLTFRESGEHPDPVAVLLSACNRVELWLEGRRQPPLMLGPFSSTQTGWLNYIRFWELLEGLPRSTSLPPNFQRAVSLYQSGSSSWPKVISRSK